MEPTRIIKLAFEFPNVIFTSVILLLFIWDLWTFYRAQGLGHVQLTGSMTGVGILGTFMGIVLGLMDFDTFQIQASIPMLLAGMKTAFVTSVVGLAASILTEIIEKLKPVKFAKVGDPVAETIHQHMVGLNDLIRDTLETNRDVALNVAALRTETKDQMSKSRAFFQEEFGGMKQSMDQALEKLAKGATEEIIKSLEAVIRDFNNNLVEQFGENFKQLNAACLKLVEWQKDFKEAVESATSAIVQARGALSDSAERFEEALERKQEFVDVIHDAGLSIKALAALNDRLDNLAKQESRTLEEFQKAVSQFGEIAENTRDKVADAVNAVSDQQQRLINNADQIQSRMGSALALSEQVFESTRKDLLSTLELHAESHKNIGSNIKELITWLEKGGNQLETNLDSSLQNLETALTSLTTDFGNAYRTYLDGLRKLTNPTNPEV